MNRDWYLKSIVPYRSVWMTVLFFCLTALLCPLIAHLRTPSDSAVMPSISVSSVQPTFFVPVYLSERDETVSMDLQSYLCGVLYGEMPPNYHEEALKAQTVAAFTYLLYRRDFVQDAHPTAWVCDDPSHCKAYRSSSDVLEEWGTYWFEMYSPRIRNAVSSVLYTYMTYEGEPINAVFHSVSSGQTEQAADVWGTDLPYLQAVPSSFDETADRFETEQVLPAKTVSALLAGEDPSLDFADSPSEWITQTVRSASGGVIRQTICGKVFRGTDLRRIFGLRSTNYTVTEKDGMFTFSVKGYGHGVGMSQYGANQLAMRGYDYRAILQHYYTGVSFSEFMG